MTGSGAEAAAHELNVEEIYLAYRDDFLKFGYRFEFKACEKNNHRHIVYIPRIIF